MKDKIKGKAEELKGKVTGDKAEELKGKARQGLGQAKEDVRDVGRELENARGEQEDEQDRPAWPEDKEER